MPDADPDCIFCEIAAGDLPSERVDEDMRTVAFMDVSPATRGHALVIPRRHTTDLLAIEPAELAATVRTARRLAMRAVTQHADRRVFPGRRLGLVRFPRPGVEGPAPLIDCLVGGI